MNNPLLERYIGRYCTLIFGRHGGALKATILSVQGNWLEAQAKEEILLINADHLSQITPV